MLSSCKVLIVGSGLLGVQLNSLLRMNGYDTRITFRNQTTDKNREMAENKKQTKSTLLNKGGVQCDFLQDYQRVVREYRPNFIVNTIPQPPLDLLQYLLSIEDCFKVEFSSPASDFARAQPAKCPPGSYPGDKLNNEKLFNARGHQFKDAIVVQIGFIPELSALSGKPVPSGLSFETMVTCNLLTGLYDADIQRLDEVNPLTGAPILRTALNKYDRTKGFTCTPVLNIHDFVNFVIQSVSKGTFPSNVFGRTLAMHSSQVWPRAEIINVLISYANDDVNSYVNPLPYYYGQKTSDEITKPVREFVNYFPDFVVTHSDVVDSIVESSDLFITIDNREMLIKTALQYAKDMLAKENEAKSKV